MGRTVSMAGRLVGEGQPVCIVAEIGINHNGDVETATRLIDAAAEAGCDAVKFQKRTPERCVPREQWGVPRDTPWGVMPYIDYRHRLEFGAEAYQAIDRHCRARAIPWFASCWDEPAVEAMAPFDLPCYKVASAHLTNDALLRALRTTGRPIILSTGMSTLEQIRHAVDVLGDEELVLLHCTSTYPAKPEELNLRMIETLRRTFACPVGYSGHEVGLQTSLAAAALGACLIERHITLDRAMWGSDQAASVEPQGFARLVRDIRVIESAMGDGVKRVYESERPVMARLRKPVAA
ncbi:MAG: N-acetylneuraminate synthase family protein [Candidatus Omnitrophica bacterium]|nr:N-acetylneuraminate synthase family protein [Candidatus Omnitrophota bacterium]